MKLIFTVCVYIIFFVNGCSAVLWFNPQYRELSRDSSVVRLSEQDLIELQSRKIGDISSIWRDTLQYSWVRGRREITYLRVNYKWLFYSREDKVLYIKGTMENMADGEKWNHGRIVLGSPPKHEKDTLMQSAYDTHYLEDIAPGGEFNLALPVRENSLLYLACWDEIPYEDRYIIMATPIRVYDVFELIKKYPPTRKAPD